MSWTYEKIETEWLGPNAITVDRDEAVAAFERCERLLGEDWITRSRLHVPGTLPTLNVIRMGQRLTALEAVVQVENLLAKIRANDRSACAELEAIFLLRSEQEMRVELEPEVGTGRKCDFRIQRAGEPWTYVEVTNPDYAEADDQVQKNLAEITDLVEKRTIPATLEVFLRREPNPDQVSATRIAALALCAEHSIGHVARRELPQELGTLFLNEFQVGIFAPSDHGEEPRPMLGRARTITGGEVPSRQVVARIAYADERAEEFIRREAKQLPTGAPGLIMVDISRASGGSKSWAPLVERRFQPSMHTRVGGICLFSGGLVPTESGHAMLTRVQFIPNRHATIPLPRWIRESLDSAGASWNATMPK